MTCAWYAAAEWKVNSGWPRPRDDETRSPELSAGRRSALTRDLGANADSRLKDEIINVAR